VRAIFRDIDADVVVMVDGDGTYPADRAADLVAPVLAQEADMVVGTRLGDSAEGSFRSRGSGARPVSRRRRHRRRDEAGRDLVELLDRRGVKRRRVARRARRRSR